MHRRFCCLALAGGLLAAAGFFDMAEAQSISFDKGTWSGELSFDDPKYAEAISVNPTATLEFSIDDRGKVLGTVEIAGSRDKYRGVLGGGLSGSELALSATLQTTADLPTSDERAQWLVKSSRMPLKLIGRVVAAGGESRVEGSGTLDLFSPDCVVGAIMSERLIDCPKRPVAMIWRATGPAGAGDIGSEPEHRTATVELQRQREQNREREAAIPEDCRVEVLEVTGVVEIVPHGPPGPANPEIAEPLASGKQGLGAIPLNQGSRYICDTDTLYTGLESGAVLRLRDGTIVTVGESADLKPRKPKPGELPDQTKTRLWLETGRIEAELTKPQPAAMDLQVKTPTATLSRRGTTFTVAHTDKPEPRTTVTVSKGVVEVIPDNPALDIAWVRPGGEVQVTQTEVVPAGNVNLERRLPAATQDSVALAEPPGEGPVKNGHPPSAEPPGEGPIKNGHPASVEPEAEAPKNGNPALAQAADGHMAGPESESGPTNGHGPGPGMDVPTNGAPAPTREGVESEAGPQAYPAPAPQGAIPQVSQPPRCDIAGQWRLDTANVGQSTWTFTPAGSGSYAGVEQGLGNATGTAVMNGNSMQLQWSTGGYSGVVELSIDPSCSAGQGQHIFYSGRAGSESTRWTRIATAPVPAPAAATGGDAGGDFVGPAPSPIKLHAVIGGVDITAVLIRTGPDSWEWVESGNTFRFRPLLDSSDQLVIYDRSRDMFHRLNFKTGETAWRVGKLGGGNGNWNPHYTIVR